MIQSEIFSSSIKRIKNRLTPFIQILSYLLPVIKNFKLKGGDLVPSRNYVKTCEVEQHQR